MRTITTTVFALIVSMAATTASADDITIKDVAVSVMDVYVPSNQKAEDDAFVVANGLFPNSCYSINGAEVRHIDDFTHQIRTIAKVRSGICLRVLVPFNKEISLGKLKQGEHKLSFLSDDDTYFDKILVIK